MSDEVDELATVQDQLRAAKEVIAALQRRIARDAQRRDPTALPADKAIASLENTVELRNRELARSEAHYRALFDHSPNLGFIIDDLGIIVSANATAKNLLERELADIPLVELFEGQARDAVEELLTDANGEANELELTNGRIVDIIIAAVPGFGHTQVVMRDVSERVELSRELHRSRRLAAIGNLAAGVAHEINNPLAVLRLGLAELPGQDADARAMTAADLSAHTDRIARVVTSLRNFASPRSPQGDRVELREVVDAARQLASVGNEDTLGLEIDIEPATLALTADRVQLEQVLFNLLTNAARATADRRPIRLSARAQGDRVVVQVFDEGAGLPASVLEQVFTPFVSGGGERIGSGLGLAMSWSLIQDNGGTMRAFNRPEGGVGFELALPLAPALAAVPAPAASAPEPEPVRAGVLEILCVEDEPSLRRSLVRLLGVLGHEATAVESAELAVKQLEQGDYGLVISDVRLPGMTGEELRQLIAERHPRLRDRVLLMSGYFPERQGTPHFLQKPFSFRQLNEAIEAIVAPSATAV